jgi:hypothetical protein
MLLHTNVGLAEESASLGGGRGRRWVLDLRRGGGARLAHGVGAVHDGGVCGYSGMCLLDRTRLESCVRVSIRGVYGINCCCECGEGGGWD